MIYRITFGRLCPRCTPDFSQYSDNEYEEYMEYQYELPEEHECPFRSLDRKGNKWTCVCCTMCEHQCSKFYRPHKSNELRHEIKAAYGIWL